MHTLSVVLTRSTTNTPLFHTTLTYKMNSCGSFMAEPDSKISSRRVNMRLETCTVSLHPTLGAMLATFGQLTEFRVAFGGSRGTVTLIYGDKRRKRTRGKKPSAPGAAKGEPKPAAKLPAAVPSFVPPPAQPGASRGVQSWWLNHRWRARLVTGAHLLLQPGRPGRDLDRCFLHTRLPRGRRQLDLLFFLQLRSSLQLPWRFPLSRWPRKGRHHRRCLPRR